MSFQVIVNNFEQDEVGDWVMLLSCGHRQHVRHQPPFINRPWAVTEAGRRQHLDMVVTCTQCQRGIPVPDSTSNAGG